MKLTSRWKNVCLKEAKHRLQRRPISHDLPVNILQSFQQLVHELADDLIGEHPLSTTNVLVEVQIHQFEYQA